MTAVSCKDLRRTLGARCAPCKRSRIWPESYAPRCPNLHCRVSRTPPLRSLPRALRKPREVRDDDDAVRSDRRRPLRLLRRLQRVTLGRGFNPRILNMTKVKTGYYCKKASLKSFPAYVSTCSTSSSSLSSFRRPAAFPAVALRRSEHPSSTTTLLLRPCCDQTSCSGLGKA